MGMQGNYPIGSRNVSDTDTLTSVVTGATADLPVSKLRLFLQAAFGSVFATSSSLAASAGASLIGFLQSGTGAVTRTAQDKLDELVVSVLDFGAHSTTESGYSTFDSTAAITAACTYAVSLATTLTTIGGGAPFVTVSFPAGRYFISQIAGVVIPNPGGFLVNLAFESDSGANIVGNGTNLIAGTNIGFDFQGSGFKNIFSKLVFSGFATAIKYNSSNRDESMLRIRDCESNFNDVFLDTVSYAASRSTMIDIRDCLFSTTRVVVNHYTDQMSIRDCWFYIQRASLDAILYLSGEGNVSISESVFIPDDTSIADKSLARWIDFVSDTANSSGGNRSLKTLTVKNCRMSLEGSRPFIWTYDNFPVRPNGGANTSSITIDDCYLAGVGIYSAVTYKTRYPGNVNLRNCKVYDTNELISVDAANSTYPTPSTPSAGITAHVIMIDEATRLSQANSLVSGSLIDSKLEPFCYDTTSQTSKYKRSIMKNIDYRLSAALAPGAGANKVKTTIPVLHDPAAISVPNRGILTFLLVTVGDANGVTTTNMYYSSTAVCLVTLVGGFSGTAQTKIIVTPIQDAVGGGSFSVSAVPTVFFGTGDTGSNVIAPNDVSGTGDNMTFVWNSSSASESWAYIVPLAGLRENQQDKAQYGVW